MTKHLDPPTRTFDIAATLAHHERRRACFTYGDSHLTGEQYIQRANALSRALLASGMKRGEVVAIICDNRPEWNIVDVAVTQAGGILLPLSKGLSAEEYIECITQAKVRIFFMENGALLRRFRLILPQMPMVNEVVLIEPEYGIKSLDDYCCEASASERMLSQRRDMVTTDDICTLIYTGGGTYCRFSHRSLLDEVSNLTATVNAESGNILLGNNALCTRFGRTKNYACQLMGRTIRYPVH